MRAHVVLEDGFHLVGEAFVGEGQVSGEVVFNTAHTGYQEVLTDPSYTGQAVVFTYPLIGSIGVNPEDAESSRIAPAALIVREYVPRPSNWRATMSLADWLKETGVIGVHQIDTRALVRHLRQAGSLKGIIATIDGDLDDAAREELARKAAASPGVVGQDLVRLVGTKKAYEYVPGRGVVPAGSGRSAQAHARAKLEAMAQAHAGTQAHAETEARAGTGAQAETQAHAETQAEAHALTPGHTQAQARPEAKAHAHAHTHTHTQVQAWREAQAEAETKAPAHKAAHLAVLDCGVKRSVLDSLAGLGCRVTVLPPTTPAQDILTMGVQAVIVSNGPGDPTTLGYIVQTVDQLLGRVPVLGICLGHQIVAQALGLPVYRLKFGHHGGNHPVKELATGRVEITSHNHGFAVAVPGDANEFTVRRPTGPVRALVTHRSLYDGTVEGLALPELNVYTFQYHPEAGPGPHDARGHFARFLERIGV